MAIIVAGARTGYLKRVVRSSPRVSLITDARESSNVPESIRPYFNSEMAAGSASWMDTVTATRPESAIVWFRGETLQQATETTVRELLLEQNAVICVPVHLRVMPEMELDLISPQPRVGTGSRGREVFTQDLRLHSVGPRKEFLASLRRRGEWWSQLALALYDEHAQAGSGLRPLQKLWQREDLTPPQRCMVLRNLAVVLLRAGEYAKADSLLTPALEAFSTYGEFHYLAATSLILQGRASRAIALLEKAASMGRSELPGSGGETWYRSRWLLGRECAKFGRAELAFQNFLPSILARPAFRPGAESLFELQLPPRQVERLHCPLHQLKIREPNYTDAVDGFLRRHGVSPAAAHRRAEPKGCEDVPSGVVIEGPLLDSSGFARVNRELGLALLNSELKQISFQQTTYPTRPAATFSAGALLERQLDCPPARPRLTIRHGWPPDFRRASSGKLVCFLPWEYTAVPLAWVEACNRNVAEVWAPSEFVSRALVNAGMSAEKVRLMPLGFSAGEFTPRGQGWRPAGTREFSFLFVGGLIARKGMDLLLDAYREAFEPGEEVTLIIKASGAESFYRHNSLLNKVKRYAADSRGPHIILLNEEFTDAQMAALYRGADALVHPYRGEGFGLPLLESMGCGTPVITTDAGPAPEFCPRESSVLIPAREVEIPDDPPPLGRLSGPLTWFEPDLRALITAMRSAFEQREELQRMGRLAAERAHLLYSWERLGPRYGQQVASHLAATATPQPDGELVGA